MNTCSLTFQAYLTRKQFTGESPDLVWLQETKLTGIVRSQASLSAFICMLRPICAEAWDATGRLNITAPHLATAATFNNSLRGWFAEAIAEESTAGLSWWLRC